jgi:hypothetical protein
MLLLSRHDNNHRTENRNDYELLLMDTNITFPICPNQGKIDE